MTDFTALISFYLDSISSFLMSEPIIYLFGALILLFVIKVVSRLMRVNQ